MSFNSGYLNASDKNSAPGFCEKNWSIDNKSDKKHNYSEAIELAGNGWYSFSLLATLSLAQLAMALDMFSFAVVVTLASCDLELDGFRKNVLVTMPFLGAIIMAFFWGYISDTRGRKISLLWGLFVAFVMSVIGAFSPHWAMLAVCRLVSTCFCSCAQSATYTLIGESCPERVKGVYMLIMTSLIHLNLVIYYSLAYYITGLPISFQLGAIALLPWRVLVLILALPLGISAACLLFFYESPKFLLNAGYEDQALEALKNICRRNGRDVDSYPVKKLVLEETGNIKREEKSLLQSMWHQTVPLFQPPLLLKTLLLYFLIFAIYSSNSALLVWLPFLAKFFSEGVISANSLELQGLCHMIYQPSSLSHNASSVMVEDCTTTIDIPIVVAAVIAGCTYSILNALISKLAARKRMVMLTVFFISGICGVFSVVINNNISSVIMYFGIVLNSLNMGVVFSYCVDLYPTSFRGMAACLGVMVARISGVIGINLVGPFIRSSCDVTFYSLSVLMFIAAVMSYFLPSDKPRKKLLD